MQAISSPSVLRERVLSFLKAQAVDGFQEAVDVQLGLFGHALLIASVFPLSLVALALHGARAHDPELASIVAREADTLAKLADDSGWRYFNLFPEMPPDADDLAQAIALLVASRHPRRDHLLAGPVDLLLRNRVAPGRFRTWLVTTPEEAADADARWVAGKDPVHPEVVANLLTALALWDGRRFQDDLVTGVDWLMTRQRGGLWESYWYYGRGYGTYQVLRLMRTLEDLWPELAGRFEPARQAARRAILDSQAPDGGWEAMGPPAGLREAGIAWEPMGTGSWETALMLGALASMGKAEAACEARALEFLALRQDPDGGFAAEPYFFTLGMAPHQSRCLTAAAVLAALSSAGHGEC